MYKSKTIRFKHHRLREVSICLMALVYAFSVKAEYIYPNEAIKVVIASPLINNPLEEPTTQQMAYEATGSIFMFAKSADYGDKSIKMLTAVKQQKKITFHT